MTKLMYVFLGGGVGTLVRYALSGMILQMAGNRFPFGTLTVNLLGCFLAGFLMVLAEEKLSLSYDIRLLIFTGFLGGLTTFSAFMIETSCLVRAGQIWMALGNVLISVILGFLVFQLGAILGKMI